MRKGKSDMKRILWILLIILLAAISRQDYTEAKVTGPCANCHTMHNSQNGTAMATYGASGQPWTGSGTNQELTRGACLGCHGIGTANIVNIGGSNIPQVWHTDGSGDLAGGNFAYITGAKGSGASDRKGHNVIDIGKTDATLTQPPGLEINMIGLNKVTNTTLTCAGTYGCHGYRKLHWPDYTPISGIPAVKGAHHTHISGKMDVASSYANSYRFLTGVKGYEASNWQNLDANNHNEYFGTTTPPSYYSGCANYCHPNSAAGVQATNNTISGFCYTCHGNFHELTGNGAAGTGIGSTNHSPFQRHPTDIVIPNSGEYAGYSTYNVQAPVARQVVPGSISATVSPGTDIVMCLSCHTAHASDYPSMLRWDYNTMVAGGGGSGGCFTCHTQKN